MSVANLTAGRAVASLSNTIGSSSICAQVINTNYYSSIAVSPSLGRASKIAPTNDSGYVGWLFSAMDTFTRATQLPSDAALFQDQFKINGNTGDVSALRGNLVIGTASKGVNFTANTPAAGMTSQLLNWYEEGTWTPNQGAGLTLVGAFSSTGRYTRIGRQVSISGTVTGATSVAVTAAAGVITSNLPFTVVTAGHGGATNVANDASATVICTSTNVTSAAAIAATATITFSATYFV